MKRVNYKSTEISAKAIEINKMDESVVLEKINNVKNFIKSEKKSVGDDELIDSADQRTLCTMKEFLATESLTITGAIKKMQKSLKTSRKTLQLPKELTTYNAIERNKILIQRLNNSCQKDQGIVVFEKGQKVYAFNQSGQMLICFNKNENESFNVGANGELINKNITQMYNASGEKYIAAETAQTEEVIIPSVSTVTLVATE